MKKEREFNFSNITLILVGAIVLFLGIILIANLTPVNKWTEFHEFLKGYGANAALILGGTISLIGIMLIFVSLKTNK